MTKPQDPKDKFIRGTIAFMSSEKTTYYMRGDRVYVDTRAFKGKKLLLLEGNEFRSFLLRHAKKTDNVLLRRADADLIIEHVYYHALENAKQLSTDARAMFAGKTLLVNPGWQDDRLIEIQEDGTWKERVQTDWLFEPMAPKMRMPVPEMREAKMFPEYLKQGIADFGSNHCLLAVTCATMLLPADFVHPFIVFTGDQARGKSTTMKLILQLVDPYEKGELMSVGEDMRDIIALCAIRHSIALDNVSKLPFDEDLLSKMYSGGLFATRKMATNSELSEVETPRLRVLMNGIGNAFSRSDLISRCIFIEHPLLMEAPAAGKQEQFASLSIVEERWRKMLPETLGSLLRAIGAGLKLFHERGGLEGKTAGARFVEYCVLGECISEAMGFPPGEFTKQINAATEHQKDNAIDADDCAQLVVAWLEGERAEDKSLDLVGANPLPFGKSDEYMISPSDLHKGLRALAVHRGFSIYSIKWLASTKALTQAITRSAKNIEHDGWDVVKILGGDNKRCFKFTRRA